MKKYFILFLLLSLPCILYADNVVVYDTATQTLTNKTLTSPNINGAVITATGAELNYVDGVTSSIQTQIDAKQASSTAATDTELANHEADSTSIHGLVNTSGVTYADYDTDVDISDTGADSSPATQELTITSGFEWELQTVTCSDDDGCTMTLSETNGTEGDRLTILSDGAYDLSFAWSSGVLEHNGGTGSSIALSQYDTLEVVYTGDRWVVVGGQYDSLFIDSINIGEGTIQGAMKVESDANGVVLTASQMNSIQISTGAGDWDIPTDMCDTATGQWLTVQTTAAHVASITSNDAADVFVTSDGTDLDVGDELDTGGADGDFCTVVCVEANKWRVMGENGTCVDGGAAD